MWLYLNIFILYIFIYIIYFYIYIYNCIGEKFGSIYFELLTWISSVEGLLGAIVFSGISFYSKWHIHYLGGKSVKWKEGKDGGRSIVKNLQLLTELSISSSCQNILESIILTMFRESSFNKSFKWNHILVNEVLWPKRNPMLVCLYDTYYSTPSSLSKSYPFFKVHRCLLWTHSWSHQPLDA